MFSYQSRINQPEDFDLDICKLLNLRLRPLQKIYEYWLAPYVAFVYALANFDIFHHSFKGGFLGVTPLWRLEAGLLKFAQKKVIIIVIGYDAYLYSRILDVSLRHVLMTSRPEEAKMEKQIQERINYWVKAADVINVSTIIDGIGRWDLLPYSILSIDTALWKPKHRYSMNDGSSGIVKLMHSPNNRIYKGTEFLLDAVEALKIEGLKLELILIEGKQNDELRRIMLDEADILAEQFIAPSYGLTGVEGMACGLPVLANLGNDLYNRLFRRYSYLNECPILSTSPETLKENLRVLVTNPQLREELGRAGRKYVEKYHSEDTAQYLFGAIYDKIWYNKNVDLMNLFHPLKSEYNRRKPLVQHPLVDSKLPANYFADVATFVS
ncbi:MAG: glycosyltransferase family protein [Acidobacteriota bacterium]